MFNGCSAFDSYRLTLTALLCQASGQTTRYGVGSLITVVRVPKPNYTMKFYVICGSSVVTLKLNYESLL